MEEADSRQVLAASDVNTLEKLLTDMKYGSITLIIQDGRIIQIDKTEKFRINN